jgi:luciferase family oxidoreductase group 1
MKFGLFYELQLPRPWREGGEYALVHEALDQIELADRLGYDCAWAVEHHFLEEYSHCSAPEVLLAAASQRTRRIRLGHGIVQLPTNHPARVAERVATLDLVSHGRVEFGVGEGSSVTELHPFGRRFRDKREVWEDALRALIPMFGDGGTEYHGAHFDFPLRNVVPKPLQKPHPPLWVACSQFPTVEMAGRRGLGVLAFQFLDPASARAWVHAYYNAYVKRLEPLADYATNPQIALVCPLMVAETDDEARRRAEGWTFFIFSLLFYNSHGPVVPGTVSLWEEYEAWKRGPKAKDRTGMGLIGTPDTVRARLFEIERTTRADQIILLSQAGKARHEHIVESLELFARQVMPEFQARHAEHEAWKAKVLSGELALEEIDTRPFARPSLQTPTGGAPPRVEGTP